eukprot:gene3724-3977_t
MYKAENDPYCPAAKIRKFNDEQKLKLKEALKNEKRSEKWIKEKLETKFEDVPLRINIGLRTKAFEAASSSSANLYPGVAVAGSNKPVLAEVEILQKIIVRERLLSELQRLLRSGSDILAIMTEVVELVKALRYETVEIIEDIAQWQEQQPTLRPFLFKGVNYLIKMTNDLDYLDSYDEVVERFCFEFKQNPLAYRGGGHIISDTLTRHLSVASQARSQSQMQAQAMQSEYYLQGLLKSYYDGSSKAAVDGIEVVRLHNSEKIIQRELQRIAQQAFIGEDRNQLSYDVSTFQDLHQPQFTQSPVVTQHQGNISPSGGASAWKQDAREDERKHKAIINPTRMKVERMEKLKEEADELQAMLSHIQEKINTITEQIQDIAKRRKLLEFRFSEAKTQGKEVASQHIAAEILLLNQEISEHQLQIKENQKESYFLTLEKKRKYLVIKKLKDELNQQRQKELLKKKIEEKIRKEGLTAALNAVEDLALKVKSKTPIKSSSKKKKRSSDIFNQTDYTEGVISRAGQEEQEEDRLEHHKEVEDEDGISSEGEENEDQEEEVDNGEGEEEEDLVEGNQRNEEYKKYQSQNYVRSEFEANTVENEDDLLSPFQHALDLNNSNVTESDEEGEEGDNEETEEDDLTNVSHSAGSAFFAAKALRQQESQRDLSS